MNKIVKLILFDVERKGKIYRDLDLGFHCDPDVDEAYIHDENGPWGIVRVGKEIIDFQIFADPDDNELQMQAVLMHQDNDGILHYGECLSSLKIRIFNIRVEYMEPNDKVDYCHCNWCNDDVLVEVGQDTCPICGQEGCMTDVKQDIPIEEALELLKDRNGQDWKEHAANVLNTRFSGENSEDVWEFVGNYWQNLSSDTYNIHEFTQWFSSQSQLHEK